MGIISIPQIFGMGAALTSDARGPGVHGVLEALAYPGAVNTRQMQLDNAKRENAFIVENHDVVEDIAKAMAVGKVYNDPDMLDKGQGLAAHLGLVAANMGIVP